ncbi:MAG TPA: hypothetical protein VG651_19500 [Stellaceae bacterium]|nr:hypothetical protein [Stellaceae bacterium]
MTDADDLAQRYLGLWMDYLSALLADPRAVETLKRWMAFTGRFAYPAPGNPPQDSAPLPLWPPFLGPFGPPVAPPAGDGKAEALAALAARVEALERRLGALENGAPPPHARRPARSRAK